MPPAVAVQRVEHGVVCGLFLVIIVPHQRTALTWEGIWDPGVFIDRTLPHC